MPKDPAAVTLGSKGGKARAKNQSPEQLSVLMRAAANARWSNSSEAQRKAVGKKLAIARKKAKRKKP